MGLAMALLGYFYQVAPNNIKQSYLGVFRKLLGEIWSLIRSILLVQNQRLYFF